MSRWEDVLLHRRLAYKLVSKYRYVCPEEEDDLAHEILLAFHRATASFDPERGTKLSSWLWIHGEAAARKFKRRFTTLDPPEAKDPSPTPEQQLERLQLLKLAKEAAETLTPGEQKVAKLRIFSNDPPRLREVAEESGTTASNISWLEHSARRKICALLR
jgi:RNA polymerase sigma factor (sigma-70 family)